MQECSTRPRPALLNSTVSWERPQHVWSALARCRLPPARRLLQVSADGCGAHTLGLFQWCVSPPGRVPCSKLDWACSSRQLVSRRSHLCQSRLARGQLHRQTTPCPPLSPPVQHSRVRTAADQGFHCRQMALGCGYRRGLQWQLWDGRAIHLYLPHSWYSVVGSVSPNTSPHCGCMQGPPAAMCSARLPS